jgi:hypothetical protein
MENGEGVGKKRGQYSLLSSSLLFFLFFFIFLLWEIKVVRAGAVEDVIENVKIFLYSITAGIAALLLIIHGIKLKSATSPQERNEVKKGIIYVILGLALIIIAASFVELIYKIPPKPPTPEIIDALSWMTNSSTIPGDNQSGFVFIFKNTLDEDLTNVELTVYCVVYDWCYEDDPVYVFSKIPSILSNSETTYSHDNFCENCVKFSIQVRSDQNWWDFCASCPPDPGGNCNVMSNSC